jgi:hypothetical protein
MAFVHAGGWFAGGKPGRFPVLYVLIERQSRGAVPAIGDPDERVCAPSDSERLMSFSDSPGSSAVM